MKKIILGILCFHALQSFAQPANDEPCGAILLGTAIQTGECTPATALSWTGATNSATLPFPGCGQWNTGKRDVWYRFLVAPNLNRVNIRTTGGLATTDCVMAVYTATSCSGTFTEVACNDDYMGSNNMPGLDNVPVVAGTTYYLRIAQYATTTSNGDMKICINTFYSPGAIDPTKTVASM